MSFELFLDPAIPKLFTAAALGALIGLERELAGKDPSLRTFSLICLGCCMFTVTSATTVEYNPNADPGRIAAQIVTGIGFLGAGAIFRSNIRVSGMTTAALMWVTAAIGMAVGYGHWQRALSATIIAVFVSLSLRIVHDILDKVGLKHPKPHHDTSKGSS